MPIVKPNNDKELDLEAKVRKQLFLISKVKY